MPLTTGECFLSAEEICKIIAAAAKNGVRVLKHASIELHFGALPSERLTSPSPGTAPPVIAPGNINLEQEEIQTKALELEEIQTREDQFAELLITDPLRAEEMLQNGDMEAPGNEEE